MRTFYLFFITTVVVLLAGGMDSSFAMDSCHAMEQGLSARDGAVTFEKVRGSVHASMPCCSSGSVRRVEIHGRDGNKPACCIGSECLKSVFAQALVSSVGNTIQIGRPGLSGFSYFIPISASLLARNSFGRSPPGNSTNPLYLKYCSYLI